MLEWIALLARAPWQQNLRALGAVRTVNLGKSEWIAELCPFLFDQREMRGRFVGPSLLDHHRSSVGEANLPVLV